MRRHSSAFQFALVLACWAALAWLVPCHAWARAAAVVNNCPPGVFPGNPSQDLQDLMASQSQIHEQLFAQPYTWCSGGGWILDQEIFSGPADPLEPVVVTGESAGGEPLTLEVYVVSRTDDWSQSTNLTPAEKQWTDDHGYALAFIGGVATGPVGSVEIWGMVQSISNSIGERIHVFTPHVEGQVAPSGQQESYWVGGTLGACLDDALDDYKVCLAQAEINFDACIASFGIDDVAGAAAVGCLMGAPGGVPWIIITCAMGAIAGIAGGVASCYINYSADMASCTVQFDSDVADCWQDADQGDDP